MKFTFNGRSYRLNLKQFAKAMSVMLVVVVVVTAIAVEKANAPEITIVDYSERVVCNGDTLWSIAKEINPGKDVREVEYDIERMNIWDGTPVIHPGDIISIPVYSVE